MQDDRFPIDLGAVELRVTDHFMGHPDGMVFPWPKHGETVELSGKKMTIPGTKIAEGEFRFTLDEILGFIASLPTEIKDIQTLLLWLYLPNISAGKVALPENILTMGDFAQRLYHLYETQNLPWKLIDDPFLGRTRMMDMSPLSFIQQDPQSIGAEFASRVLHARGFEVIPEAEGVIVYHRLAPA